MLALAATSGVVAAAAAVAVLGVGTSMFTTHVFPAYVAATPEHLLARFQALVGLAQTGPVLLATPLLGLLAGALGPGAAVVAVAAVLALAAVPTARIRAAGSGVASASSARQKPVRG
jgi:hypothetical protein